MLKRKLGSTGFETTEIGFGAWAIGSMHYGKVEEKDALEALETYVDAGGNFIDTARGYTNSETVIGKYFSMRKNREKLVIASKSLSLEEAKIRADLDESRKLMNTDVLDIYFIHMPPEKTDDMNRILDVYEKLKSEKKIKAIGSSMNRGGYVNQDAAKICLQYINSGRVDVVMLIYSVYRQLMRSVFEEASAKNTGIIGRTALESGFLTGKYDALHKFQDGDHRKRWSEEKLKKIFENVTKLKEIAVNPPYENLSRLAIRFALDESSIGSLILGAKNAAQVKENMKVSELPKLPEELRNRLSEMFEGKEGDINLG
jgi:aryl-alcohol dehydrogenase-like predicted oxidoreductase